MARSPDVPSWLSALFARAEDRGVFHHGLKRGYVRGAAEPHRSRVYANSEGVIRILNGDGLETFLPPLRDEKAVELLAAEIAKAAPEGAFMDLIEQRQELEAAERAVVVEEAGDRRGQRF